MAVYALSFSSISVKSGYGDPFLAYIDIHDTNVGMASTLYANIGTDVQYKEMGLSYDEAFDDVNIFLLRHVDGQPYLKIVGKKPFYKETCDLVLNVYWDDNHLVRVDSISLDKQLAKKPFMAVADSTINAKKDALKKNKDKKINITSYNMSNHLDTIENQVSILRKALENYSFREEGRLELKHESSLSSYAKIKNNQEEKVNESSAPLLSETSISYEELNLGKVKTPPNQQGSLLVIKNQDKGRVPVSEQRRNF